MSRNATAAASSTNGKRARAPASNNTILALRQITAAAYYELSSSGECAICLEDFDLGAVEEKLRALPCSHAFHQHCISSWLRRNAVCPLCRRQLPTDEEEDEHDNNYEMWPGFGRRRRRTMSAMELSLLDPEDVIGESFYPGTITREMLEYEIQEPVDEEEMRRVMNEGYNYYLQLVNMQQTPSLSQD